jgi:hypothetical protein
VQKIKIITFLVVLFLSCDNSKNTIEGTWAYVNAVEKGNEVVNSEQVGPN